MDDDQIIITLRAMAWERLKGELRALHHAYYGDRNASLEVLKAVEEFIREMEEEVGITGGRDDYKE